MSEIDDRPYFVRCGDRWLGPDHLHRWNALAAIAWIATRELQWAKGVYVALADRGGSYWGDGPPVASNVAAEMQRELLRLWRSEDQSSFTEALGKLLEAVRGNLIFFDEMGKPALGSALQILGLRYTGAEVGFEVLACDDEFRWRQISFDASDIMSRWPPPTRELTGDPGAPSKSVELYEAEFKRRADEGLLEPTLKAEAAALRQWLAAVHPLKALPSSGTIENRIRNQYRRSAS